MARYRKLSFVVVGIVVRVWGGILVHGKWSVVKIIHNLTGSWYNLEGYLHNIILGSYAIPIQIRYGLS